MAHLRPSESKWAAMEMNAQIEEIPTQPCVLIRKTIPKNQLGEFYMEALPKLFGYVMQNGGPAGPPFGRYPMWGDDTCTVEAGMATPAELPGEGEISPGTVGGHRVYTAVHVGPYDQLPQSFAALWGSMNEAGLTPAGDPYELYVDDPGEVGMDKVRTVLRIPIA